MNSFVATVAIAAAASAAHAQSLQSSSVWTSGTGNNGHSYALYAVGDGITWGAAQTYAVSIGGYLATPTSSEENTFIYESLGIAANDSVWHIDQFNSRIGPWLGGMLPTGSSGGYQWVTGEPWAFTSWAPGEPNNSGGTENRIHYFGNPSRSQNWNDITDTVPIHGFVVEFAPTPGAATLLGLGALAGLRRRR